MTPQHQFIQDKILLAIFPGCSVEYAVEPDITLPRVLTALGETWCYVDGWIANTADYRKNICNRKLLNEDGTDATLRDQSQETIDAIALLLGWKDD